MSIVETKPAAYKGVGFLMISSRIMGGRKDALYEFPNSDKQVVEDLGLRPRSYTVNAIIPHTAYLDTRDNLLRALDDGKKGPLDHPFYGRIENIVARSYTLNETQSELGRAEIEINFAISDDIGVPQKAQNALSEASQKNDALNAALESNLAEKLEVDDGLMGNFKDAQEKMKGVTDTFKEIQGKATAITTKINQYAANVNALSSKINQLIAIPQDLANSVRNIFSTVNTLFASIENTFKAFTDLSFFNFGDNDTTINQTTQGRIQRQKNRDVINETIQAYALGYAYLAAAQVDFKTSEDIDLSNVILELQYIKIQTAAAQLSAEALTALTDLRTVANALLDDKRTVTRRVITINTKQMPMAVLVYQYYGNTELTDTLLQLNEIKGASFVSGDIKILTE